MVQVRMEMMVVQVSMEIIDQVNMEVMVQVSLMEPMLQIKR